jgi:hypothetical protein
MAGIDRANLNRERSAASDAVTRMEARHIWLVTNPASGSNEEEALSALRRLLADAGFAISRETAFPEEDAPSPGDLARENIGLLAIYAGDGTINSVVTGLDGWSGSVLVLPGGTMNLLYHRLHGNREMADVIAEVAGGRTVSVRPTTARTSAGDALAGLLAGPGTRWGEVREALRAADMLATADQAAEALAETANGAPVACREPPLGLEEGYPLLAIDPTEAGLRLTAYHADTPGEYLSQAWAMLRRNFREGPHDDLGLAQRLVIESQDGEPVELLIDGEPAAGGAPEQVVLARCGVDLLATDYAE